ncbi:unnamed protein product [Gongylonema pulchrum]|uniref:Uncharacterized protein n=1 Tax=Gongylonema pulchrum TaxID=637853 RepID=A0A183D8B2_9BILA|nr:unnamed protein product [Gongylonema pulchrum]
MVEMEERNQYTEKVVQGHLRCQAHNGVQPLNESVIEMVKGTKMKTGTLSNGNSKDYYDTTMERQRCEDSTYSRIIYSNTGEEEPTTLNDDDLNTVDRRALNGDPDRIARK